MSELYKIMVSKQLVVNFFTNGEKPGVTITDALPPKCELVSVKAYDENTVEFLFALEPCTVKELRPTIQNLDEK